MTTRGRSVGLSDFEKARITATCQQFIDDVLKPRFLPAIRPTQFNYPIDIFGKWYGNRYRFAQRYRSGYPENLGEQFDSAFTRLDWVSRDRGLSRTCKMLPATSQFDPFRTLTSRAPPPGDEVSMYRSLIDRALTEADYAASR